MTELSEYVVNDERRDAIGKETSITFNNDSKRIRVFSAQRTVAQSLCEHSHVNVNEVCVVRDETEYHIPPEEHEGENIVGVFADAPLGLLKIRSNPRSQNVPSGVVSPQDEVNFDL